jgi:hypothetical protein
LDFGVWKEILDRTKTPEGIMEEISSLVNDFKRNEDSEDLFYSERAKVRRVLNLLDFIGGKGPSS